MTDTMTREQELAEQFKEGLDKDSAIALQLQVDDLENQVETLTVERDEAKSKVAAAEKSAKAAKASIARADKSPKPRKIGPMGDDNADSLAGEKLQAAIDEAHANGEPLEIVFSDGKQEITGIPPVIVTGNVWRDHPRGMMLTQAVPVRGPTEPTGVPYAVAGYGLLIDGKQVAYTPRSEPIHVAPGQDIELRDDIWF